MKWSPNYDKELRQMVSWTLVFILALTISGCKEVVEEDIDHKTVPIIAPPIGYKTTLQTITFSWDEVEGADYYHLQIVTPSFEVIQQLVSDTNVTGLTFTRTFSPGTYWWRIKPVNSIGEGPYVARWFSVDTVASLAGQPMVAISPTSGYATRDTVITFAWYTISIADNYQFELYTPDLNGSLYLPPQLVSGDSIQTVLTEGSYQWRVRASNNSSVSEFSSARTVIVDRTAPAIPILTLPENHDSITAMPVTLSWSTTSDGGSSITDSVYLYSDTLTWAVAQKYKSSTQSVDILSLGNGTYYWRVKSIDAAGNKGTFSSHRSFVIAQ